jgi:hypothetical protein
MINRIVTRHTFVLPYPPFCGKKKGMPLPTLVCGSPEPVQNALTTPPYRGVELRILHVETGDFTRMLQVESTFTLSKSRSREDGHGYSVF